MSNARFKELRFPSQAQIRKPGMASVSESISGKGSVIICVGGKGF